MSHAAVPVLLEAALRALLLACLLGGCLRLLRVRNVPAQKAAWGLVLAAGLAMPLLMRWQWLPAWAEVKLPVPAPPTAAPVPAASLASSDQSARRVPIVTDRVPAPAISAAQFEAPHIQMETAPEPGLSTAPAAKPPEGASVPSRAPLRLFAIGWLLYLGVSAALLLRLLFGLGSSLRLWIEAKPVKVAPDFEGPCAIPVRSSRRVASPVNVGSGILLPADYSRWGGEKLRVVLAHERSHVRQRDFYLQLLAGLYAAFTWFSPLGWWLRRKLSELGEAISDRAGLEAASSPSAYAQLLLEFAALPRPTLTGVAMAHSTNLSRRIERLLNESSFHQAFTGRRRALLALALAPLALVAATALVRVQAAEVVARPAGALAAAGQAADQAQDQAAAQTAATGQSRPDDAQVTNQDSGQKAPAAPQPNPAPKPEPAPPASDSQEPAVAPTPPTPPAPAAPDSGAGAAVAPVPPLPPGAVPVAPVPPIPPMSLDVHVSPMPPLNEVVGDVTAEIADDLRHVRYESGEAYAIVGDPGAHVRYSGDWDDDHKAEIDKARSMVHGHFLWFRHDGRSYIVDDPAIVGQIEAMDKPMEDLGAQMREFGKQERELGQQEREMARKAREASRNIPTPDLSKEMADLNAAVASLKNQQGGTVTREQLAEIQRKLNEVQRRLINVQIKVDVNWGGDMGKLGQQQGEFGAKMGQMGAEMGRMAGENDRKIRSIIEESLKNGKARPVE